MTGEREAELLARIGVMNRLVARQRRTIGVMFWMFQASMLAFFLLCLWNEGKS